MADIGEIRAQMVLEMTQFRREIEEARRRLSDLEGDADRTSNSVSNLSANVAKLGVAYSALGLAFTTVIKKAVDAAATFEQSMARVQAMSGATAAEFKALEDQAASLGATTIYSASEVAEGMSYLAIAGYEANEVIAAMPGLLDLAAAAQMDLGTAADITSNILTGFRISAEQTGDVADVLTKAFTSSNTSMQQLGYAMRYVAPIAASAGVSLEETAAAVGILSNAGIQGEMAGTQLRAMLLRLVNPTGDAKDVMEQLGIKTADATGKILPLTDIIRQLQTAMGGLTQASQLEAAALIAGTEAASGMLALISTGADELARFTTELENSGGAAQQIAEIQMNTFNGTMEELRGAVEAAGIAIGDDFLPMVRSMAEELTKGILGISEMDSSTRMFLLTAVGATAGFGTLSVGIYGAVLAFRALAAAGISAQVSLGWFVALPAALTVITASFVSYRTSVNEAAAAQKELNGLLEVDAFKRTAAETAELRARTDELSEALRRITVLEDEYATAQRRLAEAAREGRKALHAARDAYSDVGDQLREARAVLEQYGFTQDEAAEMVAKMTSEVERSIPALIELERTELSDAAAKQEQITKSEALIDRYRELRGQTSLNADESAELTRIVRDLSAEYPELTAQLDANGDMVITNEGYVRSLIAAEQDSIGATLFAAQERRRAWREETEEKLKLAQQQLKALRAIAGTNVTEESPVTLGDGGSNPFGLTNNWQSPFVQSIKSGGGALGSAINSAKSQVDEYSRVISQLDTEIAAIGSGNWSEFFSTTPTTPTSGSSTITTDKEKKEKKKTEKTPEQIAQELYRVELQLIEKQRLLGKLSEQQEVDRLASLADKYKQYDAIWIDAESRRQRLVSQMEAAKVKAAEDAAKDKKKIADAEAKSAEERRKAEEAAVKAGFDKSAEWIELETRRMRERGESERDITEMQLEAWTRVRNRYGKDTDYYKRADKAMYDARMDLRKQDEKSAKEAADAIEKSMKQTTKLALENIDKQRKAELAALDERKKATQRHYDDLLRMYDEAERSRDRAEIEAEASRYRNATSAEGKKRYAELMEQLRKMDIEDSKKALETERDEKLEAYDKQKRDIDDWYAELKTAADEFNGDMITLYKLTEDERLKAFTDTNAAIKAEMIRFQQDMADLAADQASATAAVEDPFVTSVKRTMEANAASWKMAQAAGDAAAMKRASDENKSLGTQIGATYNPGTGTWLGADGMPLFHTGRNGFSGQTFSFGDRLMPDELVALIRDNETVLTPEQLRGVINGVGSAAEARAAGAGSVHYGDIIGMKIDAATFEDEIDARAAGRTGTDMATEMARRTFTERSR